jgi:hypothetical protein
MKMEYNVQILRGWPMDGALERSEVIASGQTLSNGDWVTKNSDNTVSLAGSTKTRAAGLVVRGNGDSSSAATANKAVVLWSNFVAQIKNLPTGVTFAPGNFLTIQNGKVQLGTDGTDPIIGQVLDVNGTQASPPTNGDWSIVAVFK